MRTLHMSRAVYDAIRRHAELSYPDECCGALLGIGTQDGWRVDASIEAANLNAGTVRSRYQIAPRDLVAIERAARERGLGIAGFYHSHPDGPAQWSQVDLSEAHWPGCSCVITSVHRGKAEQTRSFTLAGGSDKRFEPESIAVEE